MAETDADRKARLEALEAKLAEKRTPAAPKRHQEEHYSQAQNAWRMVIELVAGMAVGFAMGFGLDILLGTTPWLMVVFLLLGFAAGVKAMIATAKDMTTPQGEEERD
ncbi:MAG: AtpZ/AtpI family protein [Pseudomonadota bacterium]